MARIRTLKPEILEDEKTSRLSDTAFRLFTSMIVLADDHGNVRADARWLGAQVWWAHATTPNVLGALVELWKANLIEPYACRGGVYASIRGWTKHQRVDNAGKGKVPSPTDPEATDVDETLAPRGSSPRFAATRGEIPLDQEGDQEKEGEGDPPRAAASPALFAFVPREAERRMAEKLSLDVDAEAEAFRDYYANKRVRLEDKHAAFRGWLRKAKKFNSKQEPTTQEPPREIPEL